MRATDDGAGVLHALRLGAIAGAEVEALLGAVAVAAALHIAARVLYCLVAPGSVAHCGESAIAAVAAIVVVAKAMS